MYEYSLNKLATMLGVDRQTMVRALAGTPPDAGSEKKPLFRVSTASDALARHRAKPDGRVGTDNNAASAQLTAERARLAREQADAVAMKNAILRREWAHMPSIVRFLQCGLVAMRDHLLGLPGEIAFMLAMQTQEECYQILDDAIRSKLEELADPNFPIRAAAAGLDDADGRAVMSELLKAQHANDGESK